MLKNNNNNKKSFPSLSLPVLVAPKGTTYPASLSQPEDQTQVWLGSETLSPGPPCVPLALTVGRELSTPLSVLQSCLQTSPRPGQSSCLWCSGESQVYCFSLSSALSVLNAGTAG